MAVVVPVSLFAQDVTGAMLQSNGVGVLVNHYPASDSTAIFPKDLIETQKNAAARMVITGSTADIIPESMMEFDGDELLLDHGGVSVHTTRGLRVRVGCLTVTPVNPADWTQYDVIDLDGKVTVKASQSDVYIDSSSKNVQQVKQPERSGRDLVRQGEEKSREEKCAGSNLNAPRAMPGLGAALNSPYALGAGVTGVVVALCLGLLCHGDDPVSPAKP